MRFDRYDMSPQGIAQIRFLKDDGGYHRQTRTPTESISDLPQDVQDQIKAVWTSDFIASWVEAQDVLV